MKFIAGRQNTCLLRVLWCKLCRLSMAGSGSSLYNLPVMQSWRHSQTGSVAVVVRYGWPSQTASQCAFLSRPTVKRPNVKRKSTCGKLLARRARNSSVTCPLQISPARGGWAGASLHPCITHLTPNHTLSNWPYKYKAVQHHTNIENHFFSIALVCLIPSL